LINDACKYPSKNMCMHIHREQSRNFLGKGGLDDLEDCRKVNSRDYSHREGRTGNFSRA